MSRFPNNVSPHEKDLCFIDIETTGAVFGFHEIIDIGIIRTCAAATTVHLTWAQRIAPHFPDRITPAAQAINGFTKETWSQETPTRAFWEQVAARVQGSVPVCHNPSFERAFLSASAASLGVADLGLDYHWIGTESLAWPLVKRHRLSKFSLNALCQFLQIRAEAEPHAALAGADTCLRVYRKLMEHYSAYPEIAVA